MTNLLLNTDSYKASHFLQYPKGTTHVNSYIEARGKADEVKHQGDGNIVHFGLQMFLDRYLAKPFTLADIDEAEELFTAHGEPFNRLGWDLILNRHGGYLPVEIESVPEGTCWAPLTPLVQLRNTDPDFPWLTSYLETALLRAVWYPSTVATISRNIKLLIGAYLKDTADNCDGLAFKLHDFGCRGVSSHESAAAGGLAHLVNFMGTDTVPALIAARRHYSAPLAGFSIPASEHSTITAWGRDGEVDAYRNMLSKFALPGRLVACVSDSYDIYHAAKNIWGKELKDAVLASGATLVVRPDSGDPRVVVLALLEILGERFGFTTNTKGYKVLNPAVRIIQGDGVNYNAIREILLGAREKGWSADNLAFGMGGALLQQCNRDTYKYAMKASAIKIGGTWYDVYKDPVTDPGKVSKRGRQTSKHLQTVWKDGSLKRRYTLEQVRENAKI